MPIAPGKTRIVVTVEKKAVREVRSLMAQLGMRPHQLSDLLNESLKAQAVGFRRLLELKEKRGTLDAATWATFFFNVSDDLAKQEELPGVDAAVAGRLRKRAAVK